MSRSIWTVVVLLLPLTFLWGQVKVYDFYEILTTTESNNKAIRLARSDVLGAQAEKLSALASALPDLSMSMGLNRKDRNIDFGGNISNPNFQFFFKDEFQFNAVLTQTLFNLRAAYAIQASRYFSHLTQKNFDLVRLQVLKAVKVAFYQTLLLKEVLRLAKDSQASARQNYENTKLKFQSGIVSQFNLLQAEVRWQNAIPQTIQARQNYELALNNLKLLAGIPTDENISIRGSLQNYPKMPEMPEVDEVLARRPDYNALVWEKRLREKNVSARRASFYPNLSGNIRYSYLATDNGFPLKNKVEDIVFGLSLNVPVFSGGSNIAELRKASVEVEKIGTRIEEANERIKIELKNLRLRMEEAKQRIEATRKAMDTAEKAFEIAETRVENGLSTQVELKDSRVELDQARVNYYRAIFDYLSAYFEWELGIGGSAKKS